MPSRFRICRTAMDEWTKASRNLACASGAWSLRWRRGSRGVLCLPVLIARILPASLPYPSSIRTARKSWLALSGPDWPSPARPPRPQTPPLSFCALPSTPTPSRGASLLRPSRTATAVTSPRKCTTTTSSLIPRSVETGLALLTPVVSAPAPARRSWQTPPTLSVSTYFT